MIAYLVGVRDLILLLPYTLGVVGATIATIPIYYLTVFTRAARESVTLRSLIPFREARSAVNISVYVKQMLVYGLAAMFLSYYIWTRVLTEELIYVIWFTSRLTFFKLSGELGDIITRAHYYALRRHFDEFANQIHDAACNYGYSSIYCYWDVPLMGDYSSYSSTRGSLNIFSWIYTIYLNSPIGPSPFPWELSIIHSDPIGWRYALYEAIVGLPITEFYIRTVILWVVFDLAVLLMFFVYFLKIRYAFFLFAQTCAHHTAAMRFAHDFRGFDSGGFNKLREIALRFPTLVLSYLSDDPNDQTVVVGITHDNERTGFGLEGHPRPVSHIRTVGINVAEGPVAPGIPNVPIIGPALEEEDDIWRILGPRPHGAYDADADTDTTVSEAEAPGAVIVFEEPEVDENHLELPLADDGGGAILPADPVLAHAEEEGDYEEFDLITGIPRYQGPVGQERDLEAEWLVVVNNVVAAARIDRWSPESLQLPVQQVAFRNWIATKSHLLSQMPVNWVSDRIDDIIVAASIPTTSWLRRHFLLNPGWYQRLINWFRGGDDVQYRLDVARSASNAVR